MRIRQVFTTAAVLVFSAGLFAACGKDDKTDNAADTTTTAASTETVAPGDAATATITFTAKTDASGAFVFDNTVPTAVAGAPVKIVLNNSTTTKHNLTIETLKPKKVDLDVDPNGTQNTTVTPVAGTYEFHCEYHPSTMKGTLTVQ